jgi:NAD(P)-dependent dehydrogenase (short-subunit alcohol dehydrogenase family)
LRDLTPEQRTSYLAGLPKGRLIAPEEIASLIVFLASAYSAPLHGAVIDASMGLGVRPGLMSERSH